MKGAQPLDSDLTVGAFVPLSTMRESSKSKRKTDSSKARHGDAQRWRDGEPARGSVTDSEGWVGVRRERETETQVRERRTREDEGET